MSPGEFPFVFTPAMKKQLSPKVLKMLYDAWRRFPELADRKITVGCTAAHLGSALMPFNTGSAAKLTVRLQVRRLTYNTIGHEFTHLLQGLSKVRSGRGRLKHDRRIPGGEKQCDIWTLARSSLFCDDAPTYLKLPRTVRLNWPLYAPAVRRLCIAALEKRKSYRLYMRWLETRIKDLSRKPVMMRQDNGQLPLPF